MENSYVVKLKERIKNYLKENKDQSVAHRWDHLERVYKRALDLSKEERVVDVETLEIATLLHDINEPYNEKELHVEKSVRKAKQLLRQIGYPQHRTQKVLEIISTHSSEDFKLPNSIEGKLLFDADKLDGLGAIGIARVFALCGQRGMTPGQAIKWYKQKIKKAKPLMQTERGRKIGLKQLEYVNLFLNRYLEEENLLH